MNLNTLNSIYNELIATLNIDQVLKSENIKKLYGHDEMENIFHLPDLVVFPHSTRDVSVTASIANKYKVPIIPRGAGTGLVGGCVPLDGGISIDISQMNKIIDFDEINMTLKVEAGVLLKDVISFSEEKGYLYAPDPGEKTATIGGNISTNAGGMRAVKYGTTRNSIAALTVVTVNGQTLHLGGKVSKNSSGIDLKDLFIGSEGILGIVTEAVLKLLPIPKASVSLMIPFKNFSDAIACVPKILNSGVKPTAIEFFEKSVIECWEKYSEHEFPENGYAAYLLMTFDGLSEERVTSDYETIAELCLNNDALDAFVLDTPDLAKKVWSARDSFLEAIKNSTPHLDEVDIVVPRSKIVELIDYSHKISNDTNVRISEFGHAGDGNLHMYICQDTLSDEEWPQKLAFIFDKLYTKAEELSGKVSGEHGIGFAKKDFLSKSLGSTEIDLMKSIKLTLDPNNILNPHKVVM